MSANSDRTLNAADDLSKQGDHLQETVVNLETLVKGSVKVV